MSARKTRPSTIWDTGPWDYTNAMPQAFTHEELPLKQQFIEVAREYYRKSQGSNKVEFELAAALLYMNVADYLAEYLVNGLAEMSKEAMNKYYMGVVSVIPQQKDSFNIGNAIHTLKSYDFPKKREIMKELNAVNDARKKIAHQVLKTRSDELPDIDTAVDDLVEHTELLVNLVDEITPGMPPRTLIEKMIDESVIPEDFEATEKQQKNSKPKKAK